MMSQTIADLYDEDFVLWVEVTVARLRNRDFNQIDWVNLIEEVESLGKRDKRELDRLTTLFEHALKVPPEVAPAAALSKLKRCYVSLPDCYRGWEVTITRTQQELSRILRDSPSLQNYFLEVRDQCYMNALKNVRREYDAQYPDHCSLPTDIDKLLNEEFYRGQIES